MKTAKSKFLKDLLWYFAGSLIPLLVGFFRAPIFTRYFTAHEYGVYGIILITYTILSVFLFSWLSNCIWRFYNKFKKENNLTSLYSNLFILYLIFSAVFLTISIVWNKAATDEVTKKLIILIFTQFLVSSLNNYFLIVHRLEERSALFNSITGLRAISAFAIQYYLTFTLNYRIEAIPISMIVIETVITLYLVPLFYRQYAIKLSAFSWKTINLFFGYSIPGILSNLGLYILTSSDRYVIALFEDMDKVGIYNQIYNLSQISMMAIINLFLSVINPVFIREMELNFNATGRLTSIYMKSFILITLPLGVYFSLFAKVIAYILLGPEFRVGYPMIPWIAFAMFLYGVTLFSENRLKFNLKYKTIIVGFILCSTLNLAINFITIPKFGYEWAAISTLISYALLTLFFVRSDFKLNKLPITGYKELIPAIIVLILQVLIYKILQLKTELEFTILNTIIIGVVYSIIYIIVVRKFNRKIFSIFLRVQN